MTIGMSAVRAGAGGEVTADATEPVPVVALDYFEQSANAWPTVVRWVLWFMLVEKGWALLVCAVSYGCYAWHLASPAERAWPYGSASLLIGLPSVGLVTAGLLGTLVALRRREGGRRCLVFVSAVQAVVTPIASAVAAIYFHERAGFWKIGPSYEVYQFATHVIQGLYGSAFEILVCLFFRRPEVRAVFAEGRRAGANDG